MPTEVVTSNTASSFSAPCWRTGAAGFVDDPPNTTEPDAANVYVYPNSMMAFQERGAGTTGQVTISAFLADGTSASFRHWYYDAALATWVALGAAAALTYASTNASGTAIRFMPGAKLFCQITANVGATMIASMVR